MGFDITGRNPTTEAGRYFAVNIHGWHPMIDYIEARHPDIAARCSQWRYNDWIHGLDADDSRELSARLKADLFSGTTSGHRANEIVILNFADFLADCGGFVIG